MKTNIATLPLQSRLVRLLVPLMLGFAIVPAPAQTIPAPLPTLEQVQALHLQDGVTLTYTVVETDVRSPQLKAAQAAGVKQDYQRMVSRGECTQAQADGMIKMIEGREKVPHPPKVYSVTLSSRDGKLLCISRQSAGSEFVTDRKGVASPLPMDTEVILYDSKKTYDYSTQMERMTIGNGWHGMRLALLPGVGLPGLPLIKPSDLAGNSPAPASVGDGGLACNVLETQWFNPGSSFPLYQWGEVYAGWSGGVVQVTKVTTVDGEGRPLQEWRYDRPQRFGGIWLPRRVHMLEYQPLADGRPSPERSMDFSVSQAVAHTLPAAKFDIRTYLSPGAGIYEGNAYHYRYDPRGGDLETQRRVQTARQVADAQKERHFSDEIKADRSDHGDGSDGNALLMAARSQAGAQGKNVLLIFHASWCGPCFMLHHLLNEPQVKPLIQAHYVVVEEDIWEHGKNAWENPGGQALFQRYGGRHAIPFYAILTPGGKKLQDSIYGTETMGVPSNAGQEKSFLSIFQKTARGLTPADLSAVKAAVERNTVMH